MYIEELKRCIEKYRCKDAGATFSKLCSSLTGTLLQLPS